MKKLWEWSKANILFFLTLFLLAFIPLYPKLPLIDIPHVWVYVRVEDFVVLFVLMLWLLASLRNKLMLKTPLTIPIIFFWLAGVVSTIHGILLIFPAIANVFPNIALLGFIRRIEYMSLFFVSYTAFKDKKYFRYLIFVLISTLILVVLYGLGQKYMGFPAFLTMNEEFAKGIYLRLSPLSRVSSTFGGQYDLAAYLVFVIPIIVSLIFGYRNWLMKLFLVATSASALLVLFMTVSRISFFAFCVAVGFVLLMQKKKLVILALPVIGIIVVSLLYYSPSLTNRFVKTVKETDILVDARTGIPLAQVREVPKTLLENKVIRQHFFLSIEGAAASPSASVDVPYALLPEKIVLYVKPNAPTGEDLPQGTEYINLPLSPISRRVDNFYYEYKPDPKVDMTEVTIINGDYLIKKALAYDLSFTTRFQAEWPNALAAFQRNILFGSGYGSVSLAVDNSYLRMLGEVGLTGFISFLIIFLIIFLYVKKALPNLTNPVRSFVIGYSAGMLGLVINAMFIDVFEASKVAFVIWIVTGAVLALIRLYKNISFDVYEELKKVATSTPAIILYLLLATVVLFSSLTRNYFVGDDFTWLRWVADCKEKVSATAGCPVNLSAITGYFTHSNGFFYRPGAKTYFLIMYSVFWLNQNVYHLVSLFLHFAVAASVFLLAKKIFRSKLLAALSGLLFLTLSGYSEAVFWISATGFLFTSFFSLASLLTYIAWLESRKKVYFISSLVFLSLSLIFHELGIVTPLLILLYHWLFADKEPLKNLIRSTYHWALFLPVPLYLFMRLFSQSHWLSGDYSYNLLKLPFNFVGNIIGYLLLTIVGPMSLPVYIALRNLFKGQIAIALIFAAALLFLIIFSVRKIRAVNKDELKIILFGSLFFVIALLPFIGLGNITSRYSYYASIGLIFLLIYLIKKFYLFILGTGREIALSGTVLLVLIFSLFQLVQQQQERSDWYEAGEKVRRFIVSVSSVYTDTGKDSPLEFHFVNVPIRQGQAWVFPVGLPDALWFVFRNPALRVYTWPSQAAAFMAVQAGSLTQKVFVFNDDGTVVQAFKPVNYTNE